MSKRFSVLLATTIFFVLSSSAAFAEEAAAGNTGSWFGTEKATLGFAYLLAMGIAAYGGTQAQSRAAAAALEGIARNPSSADKIQIPMIIALALMESLIIFTLISIFLAKL